MSGSDVSRVNRDITVDRVQAVDRGQQPSLDIVADRGTLASSTDKNLGKHARRQDDLLARLCGGSERLERPGVMSVGRVEKAKQQRGVEDYRSHSSLSASRSVAALSPGKAPARSS